MADAPWLDTIAAIATPVGTGAISLIRLSGPRATMIAEEAFRGTLPVSAMKSRRQHLGQIVALNGEIIDSVLLTVFRAPGSYTGEETVEIAGHGGMLITRLVLEALIAHGARQAEPGEFTQRAFINGKVDLTQAEAVMDLISAQTTISLQTAQHQLAGALGRRIIILEERVLTILAHVEAYIDFPDEDIDPQTGEALLAQVDELVGDIDDLQATARRGQIAREGVRTVIYGSPNVGKSSLLNLLLGYDRALVSSLPGTTRDSIEETIDLHGLPLRIVDTAGVRDSGDAIEQAGIARTHQEMARADLVLHVFDATMPKMDGRPVQHGTLEVLNKVDLGEHPSWEGSDAVRISCTTGSGIAQLASAIQAKILSGEGTQVNWSVAVNARHQELLRAATAGLARGKQALLDGLSPEFVAEELRGTLHALGEIVGRRGSEDLLGKIFSTFCIGK